MKTVPQALALAALMVASPALASDGQVPIPDYGTRLTVPASGVGTMAFAHPAYEGARATVRIADGRVVVGTDADALTIGTYDPANAWNDEMSVLLMDVNFDGFLDIGVLDGVGYGGVNYFWSFHRADANRLFVPVGTLANPELDDIMGTVLSNSRSGPFWTREVFRPQGDGLLLQFSRTFWGEFDLVEFPGLGKGLDVRAVISQIAPDPWDEASVEDPMFHVTAVASAERSYFHDAPDEMTARSAYLVEGDIGRVLDVDSTGDWLYVTFTHSQNGNTTTGWMRAAELTIIQG